MSQQSDENESNLTNHDQPFVFNPQKGITLNFDKESLPSDILLSKFEMSNTNPLIKNNKTNNFSEYDHYIEDPSAIEIQNELLENVVYINGQCCLKKDAVDILYCCFDLFSTRDIDQVINGTQTFRFYTNILLLYPPELKHNSLIQYFSVLQKVFENQGISKELKYMLTNKALEVEWEKCNFVKYTHFKIFFSIMKRVFKNSPLILVTQLVEGETANSFQELLRRTMNGRATSILSYLIDAEDPLKILMLFKAVEWIQKMEQLKIATNVNINYIIRKTTDKFAVELLKQMYGKVAIKSSPEDGANVAAVVAAAATDMNKNVNAVPLNEVASSTTQPAAATHQPQPLPSTESLARQRQQRIPAAEKVLQGSSDSQPQPTQLTKNSNSQEGISENYSRERLVGGNSMMRTGAHQANASTTGANNGLAGSSSSQSLSNITINNATENNQEVLGGSSAKVKQPHNEIDEQLAQSILDAKHQHKFNQFFEIQNATRYQEDFGGRINNFLKKAFKNGFKLGENDQVLIEQIIGKFKLNISDKNIEAINRNYQKFCKDFGIEINEGVVTGLSSSDKQQKDQQKQIPQKNLTIAIQSDSNRSRSPPQQSLNNLKAIKVSSQLQNTGINLQNYLPKNSPNNKAEDNYDFPRLQIGMNNKLQSSDKSVPAEEVKGGVVMSNQIRKLDSSDSSKNSKKEGKKVISKNQADVALNIKSPQNIKIASSSGSLTSPNLIINGGENNQVGSPVENGSGEQIKIIGRNSRAMTQDDQSKKEEN